MLELEFNLSDTGILSSATEAFVRKDPKLKTLFSDSHPYYSLDAAIAGKKNFSQEKRDVLVNTLKKQYSGVFNGHAGDNAVLQNIELLSSPDTFTITTGQQLHLFLGPAFVIHKIIATIKAAEQFKELYPELNFVPVYWLASEDHDFEEIKSTKVFQHQFDWNAESGGATGRLSVEAVSAIIEALRQKVNLNEANLTMLAELEHIYATSENLSDASVKITHYFFGKYGLVCVDGDQKDLKHFFIPVIKDDITGQQNIAKFNDFSKELEKTGLSLQLKGRDINIFYLSDRKRSRITLKDGRYTIMDTDISFSREELLADIDLHPENYSPNAVLRPVYQETILPNICYIGGNAEVNYWLQLKDVFELNHVNPSQLTLRPSIWVIPEKLLRWIEKQGISCLDLMKSTHPKELINLLDNSGSEFKEKISEFLKTRQELQDIYASEETSNLKELVEQGKIFEKLLKNWKMKYPRKK